MTQISRREALRLAAALAVAGITTPVAAQKAGGDWRLPSDDEIRRLIAARNAPRPGQGIVIGILGPEGKRIVAGGTGAGAGFNSTTLFEIGSITKVFTALLLADMANKGEVSLDDPAAKYLPAGHRMPERGSRPITLTDLATHWSGLPRMADDMWPVSHPDGQFADYTEERLLAFLDRHQLTREPGAQFEYSNIGMGLVGYLLTRVAKSDYETLVRTRITGPLRMNDTMITLPPSQAARLGGAVRRLYAAGQTGDSVRFRASLARRSSPAYTTRCHRIPSARWRSVAGNDRCNRLVDYFRGGGFDQMSAKTGS